MRKVVVILGPTATGKTRISIELAKKINGEIISADSMQVYKYMDIGTAKPDKKEMCGIKHYLIGEISPKMKFSVAKYQELALKYIGNVLKEGKMPIIVGGTGLYINSLVYNIKFPKTVCDWELRQKLNHIAKEKGNAYLFEILNRVDKEAASRLHVNDVKRVIRAIEVYKYKQDDVLENKIGELAPKKYEYIIFGLNMRRDFLYNRIDSRVDSMFQCGLIDEVKSLKDRGYAKEGVAMQAIGYKEVLEYLENRLDLKEAVELVKRNSRRYAKRQLTWFRKLPNINWLDFEDDVSESNFQEKLSVMLKHLELSCRI